MSQRDQNFVDLVEEEEEDVMAIAEIEFVGGNGTKKRKKNFEDIDCEINLQIENLIKKIEKIRQQERQLKSQRKKLESDLEKIQRQREQMELQTVDSVDWTGSFEWSEEIKRLMNDTFKLGNKFRENQWEVINATMSGRDVFVVMRTGGGKSLCYQLPAVMVTSGLTVVVSPLVSLMWDQARELNMLVPGSGAFLSAGIDRSQASAIYKQMKAGRSSSLRVVFVTPEKVEKSKLFMGTIQQVYDSGNLSRFVVDEAHCCSQWGHDYRPDYTKLGKLRALCPKTPILALTATATSAIQEDVATILKLRRDYVTFRSSFNRSNLFYEVRQRASNFDDSVRDIARLIKKQFPGQCGIVYCFSQKEVDNCVLGLQRKGIKAGAYHAGHYEQDKEAVHEAWSSQQLDVVVATIAFGMGINKPDVRFVIHHSMSKSVENYYQESGRAGRDGLPARCILFHRASDVPRQACMVFYEKNGIENLRKITAYSQGWDVRCRRSAIADALGERFKVPHCQSGCDLCCPRSGKKRTTLEGAQVYARSLVELCLHLQQKGIRVTHKKLVEQWISAGKKKKNQIPHCSGPPVMFSSEDCEHFINYLLGLGVLQEDFHQTSYSTICYIVAGYASSLVKEGAMPLFYDCLKGDLGNDGAGLVKVNGNKVKSRKHSSFKVLDKEGIKPPKVMNQSANKQNKIEIMNDVSLEKKPMTNNQKRCPKKNVDNPPNTCLIESSDDDFM